MFKIKFIALIFLLLILCADSDRHRRHRKKKRPKKVTVPVSSTEEPIYPWIVACRRSKASVCNCYYNGKMDCTFDASGQPSLKSTYIKIEDRFYSPKEVFLNGNSIEIFEKNKFLVDQEDSIENLDLSNNRLSWIEAEAFDKLRSLKSLRLSNNFLRLNYASSSWITDKLGHRLESLFLDSNLLETLHNGAFDKLRNLEVLNLNNNPSLILTKNTLGPNMSRLYSLSMEGCRIRDLPVEVFKNLIGLKHLYLSNNPLNSIPAALKLAYNLEVLDLSGTRIQELRPDSFAVTPKLTDLIMKNMEELETIDQCAFCDLSQLITIDLTNSTRLHAMSENAFGLAKEFMNATYKLRAFYADNCQFESFSSKLLNWKEMNIASISGNPLNCDEEMQWLMDDTEINLAYKSVWAPRCFMPIEKRGEFVRHYDLKTFERDEEENFREQKQEEERKHLRGIFALIFIFIMGFIFIICICCVYTHKHDVFL